MIAVVINRESDECKEVSRLKDVVAITHAFSQLSLAFYYCIISLTIYANDIWSRRANCLGDSEWFKRLKILSLDPASGSIEPRFEFLGIRSLIWLRHCIRCIIYFQLSERILDDRIDVDRRGLRLHGPILDYELVDIGLAAIVLVVRLVVVAANALIYEIPSLPAAFRVAVD